MARDGTGRHKKRKKTRLSVMMRHVNLEEASKHLFVAVGSGGLASRRKMLSPHLTRSLTTFCNICKFARRASNIDTATWEGC